MTCTIRPVRETDSPYLAAIYAPYIDTPITFETTAPDAAEMCSRIRRVTATHPWLVCEKDGAVVGYAYAHKYRTRAAFDWTSELSVYMAQDERGRGLGRALYGALLELLKRQGFTKAYGLVSTPNAPSERLHLSCGFKELYTLTNCGWKLGEWRNLTYFEYDIAPFVPNPPHPINYDELEPKFIGKICEDYSRKICEA